jgi:hypothetical protein
MPFITGDTEVLLVDNGPEAEEHRWMPVGQLLYVVVRFWLRIPTKPAMHSNRNPATCSDLKPARVPI